MCHTTAIQEICDHNFMFVIIEPVSERLDPHAFEVQVLPRLPLLVGELLLDLFVLARPAKRLEWEPQTGNPPEYKKDIRTQVRAFLSYFYDIGFPSLKVPNLQLI